MAAGGVRGADQLVRALRSAADQLRELEAADDKAGEQLASAVRAEAPKLTGYMAGTVEHAGATVTVGAPYAGYVNASNPFAARAVEAEQQRVVDIYAQGIADVVSTVHN